MSAQAALASPAPCHARQRMAGLVLFPARGLSWLLLSLVLAIAPRHHAAAPPGDAPHPSSPIPLAQLGAQAQQQFKGDGIGITSTAGGARLRAAMQDLEADATTEGLWLRSVADEDAGHEVRFRVRAEALGREGGLRETLPARGSLVVKDTVSWLRRGVIEEYRVSSDGVRQDFVVPARPPGEGALRVELGVDGAAVEAAIYGVKLTLSENRREIAYSRLHVEDAVGRELAARLEVDAAGRLSVCVEDVGAAYPVRIDPTFSDADWVSLNAGIGGANDSVQCAVVDGSGHLYVGGSFTLIGSVSANAIARWDGSAWSALGSGVSGVVYALAVNGGDVYVAGDFATAGGSPAGNIAKWDGSAWSALGSGVDNLVSDLKMMGGDLYAGGWFTAAGGNPAGYIAKWDGSTWSGLGSGVSAQVGSLAVIGGDLYVGGWFTAAGGNPASNIAKWNGSAWSALGSGTNSFVRALAVSGSDLYAAGWFTTAGGSSARYVAKWDGNAWSALGSGLSSSAEALAVSGGDVYAAGAFTAAGGNPAHHVARWNGSAWSALGSGLDGAVEALTLIGGDLYVGGYFDRAGDAPARNVAKWDGSAWSVLGPSGLDHYVNALAVIGSDLYAGGFFTSAGGGSASYIAKWDGSDWSALGLGLDGYVNALAVSGSDLYAGGDFTSAGGHPANRVARWDGSDWSALGSGVNGVVADLEVGGGYLYASGSFTSAGGGAASGLARWNGSVWSALGAGMPGAPGELAASGSDLYVAVTAGGKGGQTYHVARWNGSAWSTLGSGLNNFVSTLAVSGSDLYVGGSFTQAGGAPASHIARWNGSAWSALGMGLDAYVNALEVIGSDLYVGGDFSMAGGIPASSIAKWDGSTWSALGSGMGGGRVSTLAANPAGNSLYVGGDFATAGTKFSPYIAQVNLSSTATAALYDNHFTGNSGGVPAGWTQVTSGDPASAVSEDGTTVTITDGRANGPTLISPGAASGELSSFSLTVNIASMSATATAQPTAMMALGNLGGGYAMITNFNATTGAVGTQVFGPTSGQLALGSVTGYAGGAITFVISGDADSYRVTSTTGNFDSGDVLYSAVGAAGFDSISDFGTAVGPALGTESGDGGGTPMGTPAQVAYDRVVLTGTPAGGGTTAPEIDVQYPVGTSLVDGAATVDLGTVYVNTSTESQRTLTIRNTGTADLTFGSFTSTGSGAFYWNEVSEPIAPGQSRTVTVGFYPMPPSDTTTGPKSLVLHIHSNDADEASFDITLTANAVANNPPVLNMPPSPVIAEATSAAGAVVNFSVTATDAEDNPDPSPSVNPPSGSSFSLGDTTVNVSATDSAGALASGSFTVRVQDTTAPSIATHANMGPVTAASAAGAVVTYDPATAMDAVGVASITYSHDSGSTFPIGTTTVTITVKDAANNTSTSSFTVTVVDPPTPVSFSAATRTVNQGATVVELTLTRESGSTAGTLTINTDNGTVTTVPPFSAAVATGVPASSDYVDLSGAAATVSFAEGELSKTLNVTLVPKTGSVPNKRFSATISAPTGGLSLGAITTTVVRILADDGSNPTLTVTQPAATTISYKDTTPIYAVVGTTTDNRGIDRVEISVNGGVSEVVTLGTPLGVTLPFSHNVTLLPGANSIEVKACDLKGNVTTVTRSLDFEVRQALTLVREVPAAQSATPDNAGLVNSLATPSAGASVWSPSAANSNPRFSEVATGTVMKLTATAKTGYVFSHWEGVPAGGTAAGAVATFTMPSSSASVKAVFVDNPFTPAGGAGTDFHGLLLRSNPGARSVATEGFLTATINASTGALTGKLSIDGASQTFTGNVYGNGAVYFSVNSVLTPTLTFGSRTLSLSYNASAGNDKLTATLGNSADGSSSSGVARRALYSSSKLVTSIHPSLINTAGSTPATSKGIYTAGLTAKTQTPAKPTSEYPQGDGYVTVTLSNLGAVTLSGLLADGTTLTGSSAVVEGNECPIHVQLVTPGAASTVKGVLLLGTLKFDSTLADTDVSGIDLVWYRPKVTEVAGTTPTALATQRYTEGWPEGLTLDLAGALYDKAVTPQAAMGLSATHAATDNAKLVMESGKLSDTITKTNFNIADAAVTKIPATDVSYTLTLTQATGLMTGTFTPNWAAPAAAKLAIKGILIQKGANKGGFGHFTSNAVGDSDQEVGGVTLSKP